MKKISFMLLILIAVLSVSCADKPKGGADQTKISKIENAKTEHPNCISDNLIGTTVSWGIIDNANKLQYGYILETDSKLYYFTKSLDKDDFFRTEILKMESDKFCKAFHYAQFKLSRLQVLMSPGKIEKFVEYKCPKMDLTMRGVWNPQFLKNGSEKYSALFDTLMLSVPNNNKMKEKISRPVEIIKEDNEKFVTPIKKP